MTDAIEISTSQPVFKTDREARAVCRKLGLGFFKAENAKSLKRYGEYLDSLGAAHVGRGIVFLTLDQAHQLRKRIEEEDFDSMPAGSEIRMVAAKHCIDLLKLQSELANQLAERTPAPKPNDGKMPVPSFAPGTTITPISGNQQVNLIVQGQQPETKAIQ